MKAFENVDSSLRVALIPSKIKYANKVVLNFHKEFSVFSILSRKENDGLLQDQVFKNKEEVLEDLANPVSQIQPSFKDLDSPDDDFVIIVDESDEDEPNAKTKEPSVPRSLSPRFYLRMTLATHCQLLKDLPSKFHRLSEEVKGLKTQVHELEIELPKELKEILTTLGAFTTTVTSLLESTSLRARDQSVPALAGHANTMSAEGKKDTNQTTISQLFKEELKRMLKLVFSLEEAEKESTESDSDDEAYVTGSMAESFKTKKLKKFDFVTEEGEHIHLTEEQIYHQKKLAKEAKAEAAKQEGEARKAKLIDLLGLEIMHKYYKYKLLYD
uniref:Uncharacterized protein n=1 Tax=Tanacetum cinerariifolium TaxID=118510 RepID=A0A699I9P4_TANCI|nr:hypothetical protein [Tanacetum cinerariifolium]